MTTDHSPAVFNLAGQRTSLQLAVARLGGDYVITITNENAHLGAVAVGEIDPQSQRTTVSLITRRGHKDDVLAQRTAYRVSKATRRSSCVIAGVHVQDITAAEIDEVVELADRLVKAFLVTVRTEAG